MNRPHPGRLALILGVLAFALSGGAARAQGRPAAAPPGDRYALLVGVREYDPNELRALLYSESDVVELAEVLKGAGYRRVVLMTQAEGARRARALPTAKNIRAELKGLLEDRDAADSVVVALIGHGIQFQNGQSSYFCPMDARLADRTTLIAIDEVYKDLEASGAGVKLLLVDACRNDPQSDNSRSRASVRLESVTRPQVSRPPGGVAALFSCSAGEKAYEDARIGHGVFSHFLIKGLRGEADLDHDGTVELDELARFAKKRVPDFVKDAFGPEVRQMPVLRGDIRGLPVLLTLDRARIEAPTAPTPTPTPTASNLLKATANVSLNPKTRMLPAAGPSKTLTNALGMTLTLIPSGEFLMGSTDSDDLALAPEKPPHRVRITRPFYLGIHEVTQGQYTKVQGENPSGFGGWDDLPVDQASWLEAVAFCNKLSVRDGLDAYYEVLPPVKGGEGSQRILGGSGYRLPTEAEWEYACRAGSTTRFSFGDDLAALDAHGWSAFNSDKKTHPVGQKPANAFGLHDMHGNVWEWCWDRYADYVVGKTIPSDPSGPTTGTQRMLRGGCWWNDRRALRSTNRLSYAPETQLPQFGFRVARSVP